MVNFILWTFVLLIALSFKVRRALVLPPHLAHLPRANSFLTTLRTLLTTPILRAMELVYWPTLFQHDIMVTWFLGKWWVTLSDPDQIRMVLQEKGLAEKNLFTDLSPHALIGEYMGTNVLYSKGDEWRRHRRVINAAFKQEWSPALFHNCSQRFIGRMLEQGRCSKPIDVHTLFSRATLDALGKAVMGYDFGASDGSNTNSMYTEYYNRAAQGVSKSIYFIFPFLELLPLPNRAQDREAVHKFRALVNRLLIEKRIEAEKPGEEAQPTTKSKKDVLALMIDATKDQSKPMLNDQELINNAVVMFAAGHDTSANTLSYTVYHLCKNPVVQDKIRAELDQVLGSEGGAGAQPTKEQLDRLVYLEAVILESMRRTPTLPQLRRELLRDWELKDGTLLPKGTLVNLQIYAAMNHPKHWHKPEQFLPERFLTTACRPNPNCSPSHTATTSDQSTPSVMINRSVTRNFFGFGGGSRTCIGMSMSLMEQKIILLNLMRTFSVSLPKGSIHATGLVTNKDPVCRPVDLNVTFTPLPSVCHKT